MPGYNFQVYFDRLKAAETPEARQAVQKNWDEYKASLTEEERQRFQAQFEQYLKDEIVRFRRMADQAEEMFGVKRTA